MMMKKKHHMDRLNGFSQFQFPGPNAAQPTAPFARAPQASLPQSLKTATADAPAAASAASGNPYESIVTRNVFGLNPIPPSVPVQAQIGPPPPKITLTGITTIFGPAEALFKVAGVVRNGRPQDESYIFTEGEAQDDVEVTKIDTNKMIVSFMNHDVPQDIPLADGVASSGSAPAAPSWPGQPGGRKFGRFRPLGGGNPGGFQPQSYNSTYGGGSGDNGAQNGYNNPFNSNGQQSNYHDLGANISPTVSQLSPEDQAALVAAAHAQAEQNNDPTAPMFPPTQFDDEARKTAGGTGSGQ